MGEVLNFPAYRMLGALDYEVTKRELADRWRVSERWIELRMREDSLPFHKDRHSRLVRFNLADCERWRQERRAS